MRIVIKGDIKPTENEIALYVQHLKEKRPNIQFGTITIEILESDVVSITYEVLPDNQMLVRRVKLTDYTHSK